jgi:DNA-binding SARP family transcriptional activator
MTARRTASASPQPPPPDAVAAGTPSLVLSPVPSLRVEVLRQFRVLRDSRHIGLPLSSEQLVAMLVLEDRSVLRSMLASALWSERPHREAATCLRRALWRLHRDVPGLVESDARQVGLSPTVDVDIAEIPRTAEAVLHGSSQLGAEAVRLLERDLLPEWSEPWLEAPRESLRQVRLHTLEGLARNELEAGRHDQALVAALAAAGLDPLRESAHRIVVAVHLDEGNAAEALRHYSRFRHQLWDELRLRPSPRMESLLGETGVRRVVDVVRTSSQP